MGHEGTVLFAHERHQIPWILDFPYGSVWYLLEGIYNRLMFAEARKFGIVWYLLKSTRHQRQGGGVV